MIKENSNKLTEKEKEIVESFTKEKLDKIMTPRNDFVVIIAPFLRLFSKGDIRRDYERK